MHQQNALELLAFQGPLPRHDTGGQNRNGENRGEQRENVVALGTKRGMERETEREETPTITDNDDDVLGELEEDEDTDDRERQENESGQVGIGTPPER